MVMSPRWCDRPGSGTYGKQGHDSSPSCPPGASALCPASAILEALHSCLMGTLVCCPPTTRTVPFPHPPSVCSQLYPAMTQGHIPRPLREHDSVVSVEPLLRATISSVAEHSHPSERKLCPSAPTPPAPHPSLAGPGQVPVSVDFPTPGGHRWSLWLAAVTSQNALK